MTFRSFLQLVEIKTKAASIIPFLIGSLYAMLRFHDFQAGNFILMFVSLLSFDMMTTALNNYFDYKRAIETKGYGYVVHNAIVKHQIKESTVLATIIFLFVLATSAGILLYLNTSLLVLLLGGLSFMVGILYSFGPIAISRMPLGELFSGLFMGFGIIFISAFIHLRPEHMMVLIYQHGFVHIFMNLKEIVLIFLISIPAIIGIANIMLANNICDMDEDILNKRYTLPIYIGKANALRLFRVSYIVSYLDLAVYLYLQVYPLLLILPLLTVIPVWKNVNQFMEKQTKAETFVLAVRSFIITNAARIALLLIAILVS
ncbi:1,4-dihydroxy-2-naphthoate polyprenyltransferase [Paenibacillus marinisediminis]